MLIMVIRMMRIIIIMVVRMVRIIIIMVVRITRITTYYHGDQDNEDN